MIDIFKMINDKMSLINKDYQFKIYEIVPLSGASTSSYSYAMINDKQKIAIFQFDMYELPIKSDAIIPIFDVSQYCKFNKYLGAYQTAEFNGVPYTVRCEPDSSNITLSIGTTAKTKLSNLKCQVIASIQ